jgi:hypothetical protein
MIRKQAASIVFAFTICASFIAFTLPGKTQLAFQGVNNEGKSYKIFIYQKYSTGPGRWTFQTKTMGGSLDKPYYSDWQKADCERSTVDGKLIAAIPYGTEYGGQDRVLQAVCGLR